MGEMITMHTHELLGQVRTLKRDGGVYFAARDVCACIGIIQNNVNRVLSSVDTEDVHKFRAETNGGKQTLVYVNESGLYQLIFVGKTDKAKSFRRWVTHEVLPSIRLTGKYALPTGIQSVEEMNEIQRMVDQYLGKA